jgi:coproporphyrinogen III oxidase
MTKKQCDILHIHGTSQEIFNSYPDELIEKYKDLLDKLFYHSIRHEVNSLKGWIEKYQHHMRRGYYVYAWHEWVGRDLIEVEDLLKGLTKEEGKT